MNMPNTTWVVYLMTIHKKTDRLLAVCEQHEWEAIERARPGYHQLVQGGIATEVEAEGVARCQRNGESSATV